MNKGSIFKIDLGLFLPILILITISLTALFSLQINYFNSQLIYVFISVIAYFIFSHINVRIMQIYSWQIYIICLISLVFLYFFGIESRGAARWVDIFGFRIQFSEIFKPFLAFILATYFSSRSLSSNTFFVSIFFTFLIFIFILIQPDLGSSLIYATSLLMILLVVGFPLLWFGYGIISFIVASPFIWQLMHDYQRQRIFTFINPASDPLGNSYNSIQAIIAIGSGMLFGKGLGETTQSGLRFLPERHTDFIFATISEGLGFFGALIIILSMSFLLYKIYNIFLDSDDKLCKLYAVLVFSILFIQFVFNVGMNIGILPVVGITLPFVSYGGSSLLSNFILLGILTSIRNISQDKKVLEIK